MEQFSTGGKIELIIRIKHVVFKVVMIQGTIKFHKVPLSIHAYYLFSAAYLFVAFSQCASCVFFFLSALLALDQHIYFYSLYSLR